MANTRAGWARDVVDLYETGDLAQAADLLNVAAVASATGLSMKTIEDALSRPPVTKRSNPLYPLSRPYRRMGNAPLWSREQVAQAVALREVEEPRYLGGGDEQLPTMDAESANARGYLSTTEIAAMVPNPRNPDRTVHEQTVRRWAREYEDFPHAVALRARVGGHPGVPIVVYDGGEIRDWLHSKQIPYHEPQVA